MSFLPEISQQQRKKNINKLIHQNKKLRQEIFQFQQQINHILSKQRRDDEQNMAKSIKIKLNNSHLQSQKNSFSPDVKKQIKQSIQNEHNPNEIKSQNNLSLQQLIQMHSPLIQRRIIPQLKQQLEQLKNTNIKQNIHYILQQQDQLKILKKQLAHYKRQKQIFVANVKTKAVKLQKQNTQIQNHKQNLTQELRQTIKFNRKANSQIVQLQRDIRKYHLMLYEYKKLKGQTQTNAVDKLQVQKIKENPQKYINQVQSEIQNYKKQIEQIQKKWASPIQVLNNEYNQLKQQGQNKQKQLKILQWTQKFFQTRILVMKDQSKLKQQKQRKSLVKVNPLLQKQLQQYLKQQQQKLKKKQLYLKKHRPRQPWERDNNLENIIQKNGKKSNQNQPIVQTSHDDKNITKLKNYLKHKQKMDKSIQTKMKKRQHHRLERSWSSKLQQQEDNKHNYEHKEQYRKRKEQERPKILLKSIKMGTSFVNQSSQEDKTPKINI